jgi:hypothetical protein
MNVQMHDTDDTEDSICKVAECTIPYYHATK